MCIGPQRFRGIITDMSGISIPYAICSILAFVPAIVLHEMGHAFAAYKLGDPTAKSEGRLSFNPIRHIDPFGEPSDFLGSELLHCIKLLLEVPLEL